MSKKFSPEFKKEATADWAREFPAMTSTSPMKLYRIAGPLLIGLWLEDIFSVGIYQPCVFVHNLMFPSPLIPIIAKYARRPDGIVLALNAESHPGGFETVVQAVKVQSPLPLEGPVVATQVIDRLNDGFEPEARFEWVRILLKAQLEGWLGNGGAARDGFEALFEDEVFRTILPTLVPDGDPSVERFLEKLMVGRPDLEATVSQEIRRLRLGRVRREEIVEDVVRRVLN